MNTNKYLEELFKAFNEGRITAEVYDEALMNIDIFCEEQKGNTHMKSKEHILRELYVTLWELQTGLAGEELAKVLKTRLQVYSEILGDDVPEEYWEQIEKFI